MTLKEAEAKRHQTQRILHREDASLEALVQARKRTLAIIDRLNEKPGEGEKKLIAALKADAKQFARRLESVQTARAKQETILRRLRKLIHRLRHKGGTVVMFDDVTVSLIPADAEAVAGYVNGLYHTWPEIQAQFPKAKKVSIAVTAAADADVLDVEVGDATPDQAPAWVRGQNGKPGIYCSVSQAATVLAALERAGIQRSDIHLWTAHYDGHEHICSPACGFGMPTTADATQWTDHALGRSLDQSLCSAGFFA